MSKNKECNLLEDLAMSGDMDFISDLRINDHWKKVLPKIREINAYSLEQWEETIHYLTGHKQKFDTVNEAFQYLHQFIK